MKAMMIASRMVEGRIYPQNPNSVENFISQVWDTPPLSR